MTPQELLKKLQESGIPVIVLQDPLTKQPSVSFTILTIATGLLIAGVLSNWLSFLKGVNGDLALTFFGMSAGLYWGRKINTGKGTTVGPEKE